MEWDLDLYSDLSFFIFKEETRQSLAAGRYSWVVSLTTTTGVWSRWSKRSLPTLWVYSRNWSCLWWVGASPLWPNKQNVWSQSVDEEGNKKEGEKAHSSLAIWQSCTLSSPNQSATSPMQTHLGSRRNTLASGFILATRSLASIHCWSMSNQWRLLRPRTPKLCIGFCEGMQSTCYFSY